MITFIAHVRVRPENAAAFEEVMAYVAAQSRDHESGVAYYAFSKSVADPQLYVVVEVYRDVQAHAAHMASSWVTEMLPKSAQLMASPPDIKQYVSDGSEPVRSPGAFYRDLR
jgi:quinol monooxygenase YgiN